MNSKEQFRQDMIHWLESELQKGEFTIDDVIAIAASRAQREITREVNTGLIPPTIRSFSQLHDYVDANGYGGAFDWPCLPSEDRDDTYQQEFTRFWNEVQNRLNHWITNGQMRDRVAGIKKGRQP